MTEGGGVRPGEARASALALAPLGLVAAGSLALVHPHVTHGLWQDEAKTLVLFASRGFVHPFTDYSIPNNHILFSALLSVWRSAFGDSLPVLRALPLLCFLASLGVLAGAARRLGGREASWLACLLFGTSHVTLNFAVELRGYGASWLPVAAALWIAPGFAERGGAGRGAAYVACHAAAVALIPANALAGAILALWSTALAVASGRLRERALRLVVMALAPAVGGLAYAAVWPQLLAATAWDYPEGAQWSTAGVFLHWLWATLVDFWWLAPLLAVGLAGLARDARRGGPESASAHSALWLAASCALVPPAAFGLAPRTPPPRLLVSLLPIWYALFAVGLAAGWRVLLAGRPGMERGARLALPVAALAVALVRESDNAGFASRHADPTVPHDLYDQMYHHEYDPAATARLMRELEGRSPGLFLTDYHGLWSLSVHLDSERGGPRPQLLHFRAIRPGRRFAPEDRVYLVTTGLPKANRMLAHHGQPPLTEADRVGSTGFFEIYRAAGPAR